MSAAARISIIATTSLESARHMEKPITLHDYLMLT